MADPDAICVAEDDCSRPAKIRGLCGKHYQRWRKTGDALGLRLVRPSETDRFWSKVARRGPDECWPWQGPRNPAGYGIFFVYPGGSRQVNRPAHRYAYEAEVAPIGDGLVIDHLCCNPQCVNPAHLEPVTQRTNVRRGATNPATINAAKTHCKRGHEFIPENTYVYRGGRSCRACGLLRQRAYQERKRAGA